MKMRTVGLLLAVAALGCGASSTVSLKLSGNMPDAIVTIDDQHLGSLGYVSKRGVALPPGPHRITVEKVGYFPFDRLVEAKEGDASVDVRVVLEPVPE
jgi:hypothetical protein